MDRSRWSSACSGTRDWIISSDFSGSSPAAIQSMAISITFSRTARVSWYSEVNACQSTMP